MSEAQEELTLVDRAGILLLTLGEQDAAQILKLMEPREVQKVGAVMSTLQDIAVKDIEESLNLFLKAASGRSGLGLESGNYLKNMLVSALGSERGNTMLERITGGSTAGLEKLKWMDSQAVADFIRYEHPQIQAIVIAYLEPDQASEVLSYFPDVQMRTELLTRVAQLENVQPEALRELNDILEQQVSAPGAGRKAALGGAKTAAEIMNNMPSPAEAELMDALRQQDEQLADEIQELMFVFDNLIDVEDRGIQALLREVGTETLVVALKGANESLREKFFGNMSSRAADMLRDDLEASGPVRVSEVEGAQKEILVTARRLAESGEIVLGGGGDEMV